MNDKTLNGTLLYLYTKYSLGSDAYWFYELWEPSKLHLNFRIQNFDFSFKKIIYIQNVLVSVNQGGHICYIYFSIKKKFGETFYPLWSSLFSEVMPRKIKGDAPKKSLWSPPPSPQIPCLSLPLPHAHLTSELTPSFIQFLSRCIYILRCRAMAASHFICAGLLGSSLLSCFGLCVVSKMHRVKCKPRGHIRVTE